jgi:Rho termination factor, N-terminal domain
MPTTQPDNSPQSSFLSAVRESQAAVIDVVRVWTDIGQQLTRDLRLPIARIDLADAVDRVFDVAEQTLAAQRQLALTLTGLATRQVDIAVDTVVETIDTSVEAADTAVETVEGTVRERARQVEGEWQDRRERVEPPQASTDDTPIAKAEPPKQDRRPDGRTYEERSVEELRERAGELQIEGRSTMSKDELIAALRNHRRSRSAKSEAPKSQPPKQDRPTDRRTYEERSLEELRERARELDIEGRSTMTKDELIAALRGQAK